MSHHLRLLTRFGSWLRTPYAAAGAFVLLGLVTALGFWQLSKTDEARARLACAGARDARHVIVEIIEYSGDQQALDPSDYTGDLRDAVEKSIARGEEFRNKTIEQLTRPPPQCSGLPDIGGGVQVDAP